MRLAKGVLLAGLVCAALASVFLLRPRTFLTSASVSALLSRYGAAHALRWESLAFDASAPSFGRHRYALSMRGPCVGGPGRPVSGCLRTLELALLVAYSPRGVRIERVERLEALGGRIRLAAGPRRARPRRRAPSLPRPVPVDALRVEVPEFTAVSSGAAVSGRLSARLRPGRPLPLEASAELESGARRLSATVRAGAAGEGRWDWAGRFSASSSSGPLKRAELESCAGEASAETFSMRCRTRALAAMEGARPLGGRVGLEARLRGERFRARLTAELAPEPDWYSFSARLRAEAEGRLGAPLREAALEHALEADLEVPRFADLVAFLRDTRFAVPAPLHVLDGPLRLSAESRGDPRAGFQRLRYRGRGDLAGSRQVLVLRAAGGVAVRDAWSAARSLENRAEVVLERAALELPRVEVGRRLPRVALDRRIRSGFELADARDAPAARPPRLSSRVRVRTERPGTLSSNLAEGPVPVSLDVTASLPPRALAGRVALGPFELVLRRRRPATVERLDLTLVPGSRAALLDGLVLYRTPAAEIRIQLLDTTEKPRVELTSDPPMEREQIVSLLIFGKRPDELDLEQAASVGNAQTAMESRSLGLATLYLFGAAPIERVGFDPATGSASVKLRLPGGANLELDSDFDAAHELRLRKPLAPHWAIESEIAEGAGERRGGAATFLEWFNRY